MLTPLRLAAVGRCARPVVSYRAPGCSRPPLCIASSTAYSATCMHWPWGSFGIRARTTTHGSVVEPATLSWRRGSAAWSALYLAAARAWAQHFGRPSPGPQLLLPHARRRLSTVPPAACRVGVGLRRPHRHSVRLWRFHAGVGRSSLELAGRRAPMIASGSLTLLRPCRRRPWTRHVCRRDASTGLHRRRILLAELPWRGLHPLAFWPSLSVTDVLRCSMAVPERRQLLRRQADFYPVWATSTEPRSNGATWGRNRSKSAEFGAVVPEHRATSTGIDLSEPTLVRHRPTRFRPNLGHAGWRHDDQELFLSKTV